MASVATETRAGPFVLELERARSAISKAEEDLETAMGDLCVVPQGEKIGISVALEAVFFKLRSAKAELTRVEALIAEGLAKS